MKWSPFKPGLISAASFNGSVCLHNVQTQQNSGSKYCPSWYRRAAARCANVMRSRSTAVMSATRRFTILADAATDHFNSVE